MVPMVAVAVPRMTVFFSASWVDDSSVNANTMLCRVKVDGVTSVVAFGENAALSISRRPRRADRRARPAQDAGRGVSNRWYREVVAGSLSIENEFRIQASS